MFAFVVTCRLEMSGGERAFISDFLACFRRLCMCAGGVCVDERYFASLNDTVGRSVCPEARVGTTEHKNVADVLSLSVACDLTPVRAKLRRSGRESPEACAGRYFLCEVRKHAPV